MDSLQETSFMSRTVIQPKRSGLATIAFFSGAVALLWLWLAGAALMAGGISHWIIFPASLLGLFVSGWVCWWSLRRRASKEPAVIIDEVGIFDNVSVTQAGRVKWREMERVWIIGPPWMQFLCVLPDNMRAYLDQQSEVRGTIMRLNKATVGAPVIIPLSVLDMPTEDVWHRIVQVAGATRIPSVSNWAAGA